MCAQVEISGSASGSAHLHCLPGWPQEIQAALIQIIKAMPSFIYSFKTACCSYSCLQASVLAASSA